MAVRYIGCELAYDVKSSTVFIFNLEVAQLQRHLNLSETLTVTPDRVRNTYIVPDVRNRYLGFEAQPGPLTVTYEAEVTLDVFRADPSTIGETPVSSLPLDTLSSKPIWTDGG